MDQQALPVDLEPFDASVEDTGDVSLMTAGQYLSWVRSQAQRLPNVFRSTNPLAVQHVQTPYMPAVEGILDCPAKFRADPDWEREAVHAFSELRLLMEARANQGVERAVAVPAMKDGPAWLIFCLGEEEAGDLAVSRSSDVNIQQYKERLAQSVGLEGLEAPSSMEADEESCESEEGEDDDEESGAVAWTGMRGATPTVRLVLQLDQVLTQRLLGFLIEHVENVPTLTVACAAWLYALLGRVEKPLHRDSVALLRQLFRRLCFLRHRVAEQPLEAVPEEVARLNLLALLTGYYFGQGETFTHLQVDIDGPKDACSESSSDDEGACDSDSDMCTLENPEVAIEASPVALTPRRGEELEDGEELE